MVNGPEDMSQADNGASRDPRKAVRRRDGCWVTVPYSPVYPVLFSVQ
jgi:hypothetical protein